MQNSPPVAGLTPDEIYNWLRHLPSLRRLKDDDVRAIADVAEWQIVAPGEVLYRIGQSPPDCFFILESGLIRLQRLDARQVAHTRERVDPGDYFGIESLTTSPIYNDLAIADEESSVFFVRGANLQTLLQQHPGIKRLARQLRIRLWRMRIQVPDRQPNESILVAGRQHWSILIERLAFPLILLLIAIVVSGALTTVQVTYFSWIAIGLSLITAGLLLFGWTFADWWSDQYIITNQRVIHLTVRPYLSERQREAPIGRVINTTVNVPTPWASWLGWSDVTIGTAGMQPIRFTRISDGGHVAAILNEQLAQARQTAEIASKAERQQRIRESLKEVVDPLAAPPPPQRSSATPVIVRYNPVTSLFRYFWPKIRDVQGSTIIYRKHRIVLIRDTGLWFLAFLVVLALESVAAVYFYPLPPLVVALGVAVLVFVLARLLWVYDDWRIDIYMLTDRAVIDVERKPFYLSERRQQASLDNLQDVSYTIRSPLARMLGYGDVVMETAGTSGKQTWSYVPDPRGVQNEIISRMEASRQAKLASERKSREAEIKEWIGEYHKLQQGGPQPPPSGNAP